MIHALIVDPDVQSRARLEGILVRSGCVVATAATLDRGVQLSHKSRFDVIFCAIDPEAGSSLEATLDFFRHFPMVPKVVMSKGGTIEALEPLAQAVAAGVDDFLTKPFSSDRVKAVLARTLFPAGRKRADSPHQGASPPPSQPSD